MTGTIQIATAPGTWGIEPVDDPRQVPWQLVVDEAAAAGFDGIELGPYGYLPTDAVQLGRELAARGLGLAAGFVMEPFHDSGQTSRILSEAQQTCELLAAAGATTLVVIAGLVPERSATAGRHEVAPPLEGGSRLTFIRTVSALVDRANVAGLRAAFHPHAGTYVEFDDEIDRILKEADGRLGLCIDTGHCVYSGIDPSELLERYGEQVVHVHFKDLHHELLDDALRNEATFEQAVASGVFCALGDGSVDLGTFIQGLGTIGYDGWATYEQDRVAADHPQARPDAERSLAYLRTLGIHDRPQAV